MAMKNYTLGRGEVHFARFPKGETSARGERYMGNSPEFGFSVESESLDHMNSDHGISEKDDSVTLSVDRTGTLTLDDIQPENLALFWFGTSETVTVAEGSSENDSLEDVQLGLHYQLGQSEAAPTGMRKLSNVVLTLDPDDTATELTEGTDYTVDLDKGRVRFLPDSENVTDGATVGATFDVAGYSHSRVISGSQPIEGAIRFLADNPKGQNIDYFIPWVKLTPNGDYALKGDEWQQMSFDIEILRKSGMEAVYADGEPMAIA